VFDASALIWPSTRASNVCWCAVSCIADDVATVAVDTVAMGAVAMDMVAMVMTDAGDCAMAAIDVMIRVCIDDPLDIPGTGG